MQSPLVSLIIPAYRQEKTIEKDVRRIKAVMDQQRFDYEIIIVSDGELDRTLENAKKIKNPKIKAYGYEHNHGKGYAIRYGMVRSKGSIVGYLDAGMDLNPSGLSLLLDQFEWHNADVIIGSKRHPQSKVNYPFVRKLISFVSQMWILFLFGLNVRDTQVGMKFFKRKVIEDVLPRLLVKKFAFDIEILVVAFNLGYKKIFEAPIELDYNFQSSVTSRMLYAIGRTLWDTLAIFYRLRILKYYNDTNKRKWKYDPELQFEVNVG